MIRLQGKVLGDRLPCAAASTALVLLGCYALSAGAAPPSGALGAAATAQGKFGTIKGRVVWGGDKAPERGVDAEKGKASKNPDVCAKDEAIPSDKLVVDPRTKGVRFAIVYLPKPTGANPEAVKALVGKEAKVELDQKNCRFIPHALAINDGQTLVFKSSDPVGHNIHTTPFLNAAFNQMLPPNGAMTKNLVPERLPIKVVCDVHPWMEAYVMVFNHPFFAVTGEDGSFTIEGVPAGTQNLVVWQEKVGYVTPGAGRGMPVQVKAGETVDLGEVKLDPAKVK